MLYTYSQCTYGCMCACTYKPTYIHIPPYQHTFGPTHPCNGSVYTRKYIAFSNDYRMNMNKCDVYFKPFFLGGFVQRCHIWCRWEGAALGTEWSQSCVWQSRRVGRKGLRQLLHHPAGPISLPGSALVRRGKGLGCLVESLGRFSFQPAKDSITCQKMDVETQVIYIDTAVAKLHQGQI